MQVQVQTPTPAVVHLDMMGRLWMLSVKWLRYLHLMINVLCIMLVLVRVSLYSTRPQTYNEIDPRKDLQTATRIFFLLIVTLLMITSLALVIWRWNFPCIRPQSTTVLKPIYEVIYYVVSGASLSVAVIVLVVGIVASISRRNYLDHSFELAVVGLAIINVWMYFRSAFRLWVLSTPYEYADLWQ